MPSHVKEGLATIGIGLLVGFLGLVLVANLFGVADAHARKISESRGNRWLLFQQRSPAEVRNSANFKSAVKLGRFLAGGGFMLVGLVFIGVGIGMLFSSTV
jgi:hypothetical protein